MDPPPFRRHHHHHRRRSPEFFHHLPPPPPLPPPPRHHLPPPPQPPPPPPPHYPFPPPPPPPQQQSPRVGYNAWIDNSPSLPPPPPPPPPPFDCQLFNHRDDFEFANGRRKFDDYAIIRHRYGDEFRRDNGEKYSPIRASIERFDYGDRDRAMNRLNVENYDYGDRDRRLNRLNIENFDCGDRLMNRLNIEPYGDRVPNRSNVENYDYGNRDSGYGWGQNRLDRFDSDRFRGSVKESKQKFVDRSPRKKPSQKKSALLRIQSGDNSSINSNNSNDSSNRRGNDYSSCSDDKNVAKVNLKGKGKSRNVRSDNRIEVSREQSQVELDVRFKSNSLVAKAIVTPPRPSGGSDRVSTVKVRNVKKVNSLCSPVKKLGEDLGYSPSCPDSNDRLSCNGKKVNGGAASGSSSKIVKRGSDEMDGKYGSTLSPVNSSDKDGNSGGSPPSSQRINKRKKVVAAPTLKYIQQSVENLDELTKSKAGNSTENIPTLSRLKDSKHLEPNHAFPHAFSKNYITESPSSNNPLVNVEHKAFEGMILEKSEINFGFATPYAHSCAEKTGDSAVSTIFEGTVHSDSSGSKVETVIEEVPAQAYKDDNKYDSTILHLKGRPAHSSCDKLFDSKEHATLSPGNNRHEIVADVCGSKVSTTACGENGDVSSSRLLANSLSESNLSTVPLKKGVGMKSPETIFSVDSLKVYSPTSGMKRKSMDTQLVSTGSDACDLPVTRGSCVFIGSAELNNFSCAKESVNLERNNNTSSATNLKDDPVIVSLPDLFDDLPEAPPRYGKKRKLSSGDYISDTLQSDSDSSCADRRKVGLEGPTGLASPNISSLPVSAGKLTEDIISGINGSFNECQEIDLCAAYNRVNPEDSSAVSEIKNYPGNMAIVSGSNVELPSGMVDLKDDFEPVAISLESFSPALTCFTNRATSNSIEEEMSISSNDQSPMYPENLSVSDIDDSKTSGSCSSLGMVNLNDKTLNIGILSVSDCEVDKIADRRPVGNSPIGNTITLTRPQDTGKVNHSYPLDSKTSNSIGSAWKKTNAGGNRLITVGPRVYPSVPSANTTTARKAGSLNQIAKPRTWHRSGNSSGSTSTDPVTHAIVPHQTYTQKKVARVHNTYVRKGNSLVRKPSPICSTSRGGLASSSKVYGVNICVDNLTKGKDLDPRYSHTNTEIFGATGRHNSPDQIPKMPLIHSGSKALSRSALNLNGDASFPRLELSENITPVTSLNHVALPAKLGDFDSKDAVKSSGALTCQAGSLQNFEGKRVMVEKDSEQKITYVKRRRNQLVAAMGTGGTPVPCGRKMRASSASGYYKKRKNQLVRTSLDNHVAKSAVAVKGSKTKEGELMKLFTKGKNKLLNSSVWRSYDTESSKSDANLVRSFRVWHLFPWKKPTYLRHFMSNPNRSSLSVLSQKLLSRSRATVYTRSTDGYSLRKSKVLGVGGSNLKWSKSTESKLKKANEEVTLAVAAAVKGRKEQRMGPSSVLRRSNLVSRERIFRIGSQRYKMDPTRKTLHRITHEEDQLQSLPQADENRKKSYIPRRLFFGNDEYVRIGNGNQLVRDPKKRTRTLASEKVRWSLHTARLRLAKKQKYCQFFTRFGHCNRDDGKCIYIHDPSKVAVCTKFLNGSCSSQNCKLTHEVIPERMPDCSYFLQGLCSNEDCPYRHVHVHPSSSVCEGFLKGYCASGNECRKKHTYVCPIFEVTGECAQGSECKLHHPKKRNQVKKPPKEQKKAHRRYFVPGLIETSEFSVSKMLSERCNDDILDENGRIADYISL